MEKNRPKIGLALSGASGRAIAHIGVLEVLRENDIPIDIITACSSGSLVASSFACDTMDELKEEFFEFDTNTLFKLLDFDRNASGVFDMEKGIEKIRAFTKQKSFEDVSPRMGFLACDINTGDPVLFSLGDLARACQVSCAVPGLFAPVKWGSKYLVDGGIFSLVPVTQAYEMGADIVIGIDIAATRYMFKKRYINAWRGLSFLRRHFPFNMLGSLFSFLDRAYESSIKIVFYNQSDLLKNDVVEENVDLLTVLSKAMEIASTQYARGTVPACDIMLTPNVKHFGKIEKDKAKVMYEEGRLVALEALPEIQKLIREFDARQVLRQRERKAMQKMKESNV